ncbi:4-hydroxy-tetrahydrodipicolinate reductase, partial [bacterium]|nr:4-hydroxy-tetrahydrodipicolinate reductase [candidate division CSSED10-310 bacterium]
MIPVVIWGACGRMGRLALKQTIDQDDIILAGAAEHPDNEYLDQDVGTVIGTESQGTVISIRPDTDIPSGVVLDFSLSGGPANAALWAIQHKWNMVSGTTALSKEDKSQLDDASKHIAVLSAPNFSIGIQLLLKFTAMGAKQLPAEFDVTLLDTHHKAKKDRPSGTANALLQVIRSHSDRYHEIAVLRAGNVVGEHSIR